MRIRLKPLREQVLVMTGASSGIGLVTARMAAARGAAVVLTARNNVALEEAARGIRAAGGRALAVPADVAEQDQLEAVADAAEREFGRVDTWVNDAGVGVYGRLTEIPVADMRRVMDVTYWGVVHGSLVAVRHLMGRGGALITVGSVDSDRAIPLQGPYVAAKHAVKGFTDTLRMELEESQAAISVTLVKPSSIDTPFFEHARSYLGVEPNPVPPVYAPDVVARTVLRCAEHATREITVGGAGRAVAAMGRVTPRLTDRVMERTLFDSQRSALAEGSRGPDTLYQPALGDAAERGSIWDGPVLERSAYTRAAMQPRRSALAVLGVGVALAAGVALLRRGDAGERSAGGGQ